MSSAEITCGAFPAPPASKTTHMSTFLQPSDACDPNQNHYANWALMGNSIFSPNVLHYYIHALSKTLWCCEEQAGRTEDIRTSSSGLVYLWRNPHCLPTVYQHGGGLVMVGNYLSPWEPLHDSATWLHNDKVKPFVWHNLYKTICASTDLACVHNSKNGNGRIHTANRNVSYIQEMLTVSLFCIAGSSFMYYQECIRNLYQRPYTFD